MMMLMAKIPRITKFSHPPVGLVGVLDLKGGEGDSLFIFAHLDGHPLRERDNLGVFIKIFLLYWSSLKFSNSFCLAHWYA